MLKKNTYFTKGETALWTSSVILIIASFFAFDRENYLTLSASLTGVTSLILCAKGNPAGQLLIVIFSVMYGIISFSFAYYGEMITYLGMTAPMALLSLVSWLKNPFSKDSPEVRINRLGKSEVIFAVLLTAAVTLPFFFILRTFNTANLLPSVMSVSTSFFAVYLTFRRSAYYALAYAANDIILIVLWFMASMSDSSYISVLICFVVFLVNDIYGFFSWKKMWLRQNGTGRLS